MADHDTRIKILTQNLASAKRELRWAADKDSVRRRITAITEKLAAEKKAQREAGNA